MKYIVVYKLTFPNKKNYIGITDCLTRRIAEHKLKASKKDTLPISNAIRKYSTFEISILSRHIKRDKAYGAEMFFIKKYNTIAPNGYNVCEGGPGIKGFSFNREILKTKNQIEASRKTANEVLRTYVNKGKVKIECSNGNTYESIKQASIELNLNATCIYRVLIGEQKQTEGYTFTESTGRYLAKIRRYKIKVAKSKKKIIQLGKNRGKPIIRNDGKIFKSCEHASRIMKITPEAIRACLKGRTKKCKGFIFTYYKK